MYNFGDFFGTVYNSVDFVGKCIFLVGQYIYYFAGRCFLKTIYGWCIFLLILSDSVYLCFVGFCRTVCNYLIFVDGA